MVRSGLNIRANGSAYTATKGFSNDSAPPLVANQATEKKKGE
jgi:hypothetical protein